MQNNVKQNKNQNFLQEIFVKNEERPTVRSLFKALEVGTLLHIGYEEKLHNHIKLECHRQNEIARAIGGELNLFFRTKRNGDEILIYRLK